MPAARFIKRLCSRPVATLIVCCHNNLSKVQVRHCASVVYLKSNVFVPVALKVRNLGLGPTSKDFEEPTQKSGPLTKAHATELVLHLKDEERKVLFTALQEYESNRIKDEFEGINRWNIHLFNYHNNYIHNCFYIVDKLAGRRWRSKLGRPSKVPTLGDVDPTGTYCPVPEDWLKKKYGKIRQ